MDGDGPQNTGQSRVAKLITFHASRHQPTGSFFCGIRKKKLSFFCVVGPESSAMDVTVSRNLSVTVTDHSADKLRERQQKLRDRLQKVESKVLGVSQVMLGFMVISYSLPLHLTEYTEIITFGVPWWSAIVFIVAGAVAIETGKLASMNSLRVCLLVTLVAVLTSTLALIFYSIDLHNNQDTDCSISSSADPCGPQHYAKAFSRGVKCCLLVFTIIQAVISSTLSFFLYKERHTSTEYASLSENTPPTLIHSAPSDIN